MSIPSQKLLQFTIDNFEHLSKWLILIGESLSDEEKDKEEDEKEDEKMEDDDDDGFFVGHGVLDKDELNNEREKTNRYEFKFARFLDLVRKT